MVSWSPRRGSDVRTGQLLEEVDVRDHHGGLLLARERRSELACEEHAVRQPRQGIVVREALVLECVAVEPGRGDGDDRKETHVERRERSDRGEVPESSAKTSPVTANGS